MQDGALTSFFVKTIYLYFGSGLLFWPLCVYIFKI